MQQHHLPVSFRSFCPRAARILRGGGIGVIPTDTIYGIVASALLPAAVARLYFVRGRDPAKPVIVLLPSPAALRIFGVRPSPKAQKLLSSVWPGPRSVLLPVRKASFSHLHRGTGKIAFRVPAVRVLQSFLAATGPLAAPSANYAGLPPAATAAAAVALFGECIDFVIDGGARKGAPSRLLELRGTRLVPLPRKQNYAGTPYCHPA